MKRDVSALRFRFPVVLLAGLLLAAPAVEPIAEPIFRPSEPVFGGRPAESAEPFETGRPSNPEEVFGRPSKSNFWEGSARRVTELAVEALRTSRGDRVEEIHPWLEVKLADNEMWDGALRGLAEEKLARLEMRPLDPQSLRLLSLFKDSDTVAAIHKSHVGRHAQELEPSSLELERLDALFSRLEGRVVILLGHVSHGDFVSEGSGGTVHRIGVGEVEQVARKHDVFLLPLGCESASDASIGAAKPFNSIVAVQRISAASRGAKNLGDFLSSLAGQDLVLRFDPASLSDPSPLDIVDKSSNTKVATVYASIPGAQAAAGIQFPQPPPPPPEPPLWRKWLISWIGLSLVFGWWAVAIWSKGASALITGLARVGRDFFKDRQILAICGLFGVLLVMLAGMRFTDRYGDWAFGVALALSVLLLTALVLHKTLLAWRWLAATLGAVVILGATLALCLYLQSVFPP